MAAGGKLFQLPWQVRRKQWLLYRNSKALWLHDCEVYKKNFLALAKRLSRKISVRDRMERL